MRDKELFYEESHDAQIKRALDDVNKIIKPEETHPLLNASSTHYNMFDGLEAIEVLEAVMTTDELKAWCRGNIYKYRLRLGNKDDVSGEVKKIRTYEAYYKYLENKND